jgi:pimeloyl-ACP methyl ester carboxylesterase
MPRVELAGCEVEYEIVGEGEPVVFLHARPFVSWYRPLVRALSGRTVLQYWRAAPEDPSFGIPDDADVCTRLLARVGIERPHVVGHSYGGVLALELARQRVVAVRSLALLEPAPTGLVERDEASARTAPLLNAVRDAGSAAAMESFLGTVCGDDGAAVLDRLVAGAVAEAVAHADRFFTVELPALVRWSFGAADAAAIDCPVLNMTGGQTAPRFAEGAEIIQSWFPRAEAWTLPRVGHLMMAQEPHATAERLQQFWRPRASLT